VPLVNKPRVYFGEIGHLIVKINKSQFIALCRFRRAPPPTLGGPELLALKGPCEGHKSGLLNLVSQSVSPDQRIF
jgi:hypothetical protein